MSSPPERLTRSVSFLRWPSRTSTSIIATSSNSTRSTTRPSEVDVLLGDPIKAREVLGWRAEVDFPGLVRMMIEHDLELARREKFALGYQMA